MVFSGRVRYGLLRCLGWEIEGMASVLQLSAAEGLVGKIECYSSSMFIATVKSHLISDSDFTNEQEKP